MSSARKVTRGVPMKKVHVGCGSFPSSRVIGQIHPRTGFLGVIL
jgi:hypothetical protein